LLPGGLKLDGEGGTNATQLLQSALSLTEIAAWFNMYTAAPPTPVSGSYTDLLGTSAMQFYRIRVER
jgi:hypothetical protein